MSEKGGRKGINFEIRSFKFVQRYPLGDQICIEADNSFIAYGMF
jgi:hypothetical protein